MELETLTPPAAAKRLGVSVAKVREWMRRSDDPLPSIPVGNSGKYRRAITAEIPSWLGREAGRGRPDPPVGGHRPRR